jgi:hypothetical protein
MGLGGIGRRVRIIDLGKEIKVPGFDLIYSDSVRLGLGDAGRLAQ